MSAQPEQKEVTFDTWEQIRAELVRVYWLYNAGEIESSELAERRRHLEAIGKTLRFEGSDAEVGVQVHLPDNSR